MKSIHIRKKVKVKCFERAVPGKVILLHGSRWEVLVDHPMVIHESVIIMRQKMTTSKCVLIARIENISSDEPYFAFEQIDGTAVNRWKEKLNTGDLRFNDGVFGTDVEVSETGFHPAKVGDEFVRHADGWNTSLYTVKYVADDGSLIAWNEERKKSIFVNRNDRDQLHAYGMELR